MGRPSPKIGNLKKVVRERLMAGRVRYVDHAKARFEGRAIKRREVGQVLKNGRHETLKDKFMEEHGSWNYSIRGETIDKRNLRVVVSFDGPYMLIITVIDLDR